MADILSTPITVLHVVACLFLMLVVLIQPGKSGGMGALSGAGAQQVFGGRGAGNFLTKTTWVTAGIFFFTSMTLAYFGSSMGDSLEKHTKGQAQVTTPAQSPAAPATPTAPAAPADGTPAPTEGSTTPAESNTAPSNAPAAPEGATDTPATPEAPAAPN